jgi:hypothetical protein
MATNNENYIRSADVNTNFNSLNNNQEALNMQNQNSSFDTLNEVSTYHKFHPKLDEIKEFKLSVDGELNEKLREIVRCYSIIEHLDSTEVAEVVMRFGLMRCYKMSSLLVKSYLFKISELDRDVDMYKDSVIVAEDKEYLIEAGDIKYQNFWSKNEFADLLEEKQFIVTEFSAEEIVSMSLKVSGDLLIYLEDCINVFQREYGYSQQKTLEQIVVVGINQVYKLLNLYMSVAELNENNDFIYDIEHDCE